jgi:hypothetical protein
MILYLRNPNGLMCPYAWQIRQRWFIFDALRKLHEQARLKVRHRWRGAYDAFCFFYNILEIFNVFCCPAKWVGQIRSPGADLRHRFGHGHAPLY